MNLNKHRIVFFEYVHHYGGAQRSTLDVIQSLRSLGHEVLILDACGRCEEFKNAVRNLELRYIAFNRSLDFGGGWRSQISAVWKYMLNFLLLFRILRREKPLFMFTCSTKSFYSLFLCKWIFRNKLFFFIRGLNEDALPSVTTIRLINKYANKVFVQSDLLKHRVEGIGIQVPIDIVHNVVPNGIIEKNVRLKPYEKNRDVFRILIIGTILVTKGYRELLEAILKIRDKGYNVVLDVVGDYKDEKFEKWVVSFIENNDLRESVVFHGYQKDVFPFLRESYLFVLPSYGEGTPRSILEAMAMGIPVIATTVGGIPDLISHGVSGFLVSPKDSKVLEEQILYVIEHYDGLGKIIVAAQKVVVDSFSNYKQKQCLQNAFKAI